MHNSNDSSGLERGKKDSLEKERGKSEHAAICQLLAKTVNDLKRKVHGTVCQTKGEL